MIAMPDNEPSSSRFGTVILIAVYIILLALAVFASFRLAPFDTHGGFENFSKVAGALVGAVSALMAAIVTIINFDRNAKDARMLARLNGDISRDLAAYQSDLNLKFEKRKTAYTKQVEAYGELGAAAWTAYNALSKLGSGNWQASDKTALDEAMAKVASKTAIAAPADADLWNRVWQRANFITESAEDLPADQQSALWQKEAGTLSQLIQQFQEASSENLHPAERVSA